MGLFDSTSTSSSKASQQGQEAGGDGAFGIQAGIDASGGGYSNFQSSYWRNEVQKTVSNTKNVDNTDNSMTDNSVTEQYDYSDNSQTDNSDNSVFTDNSMTDNSVTEQYDYSDNSVRTDSRQIDNSITDQSDRSVTENIDNSTTTNTTTDFGAVSGGLGVASDALDRMASVVDGAFNNTEFTLSESLAFGESALGAVTDSSSDALETLTQAFDTITGTLTDQQDDALAFVTTNAKQQTERGLDSVISLSQTLFYLIAGVAGVYVVSRAIR